MLSEQCPITVFELDKILVEAGLPPRSLQLLAGYSHEISGLLLSHPEVAVISFTGAFDPH